MNRLQLYTGIGISLLAGCGEQKSVITGWSAAQEVGRSSDSLSTSFTVHKWNGTLLVLGGEGNSRARVLEENRKDWKTISPFDPKWIPMDADPKENRFVISRADIWTNKVEARFAVGSLSSGEFVWKSSAPVHLDKKKLFGTDNPNLRLGDDERLLTVSLKNGAMEGAEIRIPYSFDATAMEGRVIVARNSTSANGVFASSDGGQSWRDDPIFTYNLGNPIVCKTKAFFYYFGMGGRGPYELRHSRSALAGGSWSPPETLNKTIARNLRPNLLARAESDTVHVCWLDSRNERTRFSLVRPLGENYEVAYCHRNDSESEWSKDVILSKGLRYAYAPSMSVEGKNIVVAWAGTKRGKEGQNEFNASDVFFVTSKDGGNTWTKPMQVTDGFKSGITSGRPQVALHDGVIHIFYVQGKLNYKQVSAGMVKLNQAPWPILYQQRPFPN